MRRREQRRKAVRDAVGEARVDPLEAVGTVARRLERQAGAARARCSCRSRRDLRRPMPSMSAASCHCRTSLSLPCTSPLPRRPRRNAGSSCSYRLDFANTSPARGNTGGESVDCLVHLIPFVVDRDTCGSSFGRVCADDHDGQGRVDWPESCSTAAAHCRGHRPNRGERRRRRRPRARRRSRRAERRLPRRDRGRPAGSVPP